MSRPKKLILGGTGLALLALLLVLGLGGCSGTRPTDLGVRDGRLAPCKPSPNCVSSQANPSDEEHHVAPLRYARVSSRFS